MSMEAVGWASGGLLMLCAIPEALRAYQFGFCILTDAFLWMWLVGELLGLIFVCSLGSWPLIANYGVNLAAIGVMLRYRYWPRTSVRDWAEEESHDDIQ